ncbi:MAG: hypothetical protein LT070_09370 [Solirubrobacteraceae bacterium]|nr:hypothetical protein [Solirubrobacteraceae bacterium]
MRAFVAVLGMSSAGAAGWLIATVGADVGGLSAALSMLAMAALLLNIGLSALPWADAASGARHVLSVLISLAVAAGVLGGIDLGGSRVDRDAYLVANYRILGGVPRFPGARVIEKTDAPFFVEGGRNAVGYTTLVRYRLPAAAMTDAVVAFYRAEMTSSWRLTEAIEPSRGGPVLNFQRGRSEVSVNLENGNRHQLEIAVDSGATG